MNHRRLTLPLLLVAWFLNEPALAQSPPASPGETTESTQELGTVRPGEVFHRVVSVDIKDVPLQEALKEIGKDAGVRFSFSDDLVARRPVTLQREQVSLGEVLHLLLDDEGLRAVAGPSGQVAIGPTGKRRAQPTAPAEQQTGSIRGRVVDAVSARPIAGAQIQIVGTQRGGLTNANGDYLLLNVPPGSYTVRAQFIGYGSKEVAVQVTAGATANADFSLKQDAIGLDELVVTGTVGRTEKRALGNSVTTIKTEQITAQAPIHDVQELLASRSPGVTFMAASGQAGASSRVRIRGSTSLNARLEPVYYVDGVRVNSAQGNGIASAAAVQHTNPLDAINPEDIESIEVVKGPAAATLYGAEAAGGVIQIITKKGRAGQGIQWTADFKFGQTDWALEKPMNYSLCTTSADAAALGTTVFGNRIGNSYWPGCSQFTADMPLSQRILKEQPLEKKTVEYLPPGATEYVTLPNKAIRKGSLQSYVISARGGGDRFNYYLSAEKSDEQGIYYNNYSDRTSARANFGFVPNEQLNFNVNISYAQTEVKMPLSNDSEFAILRNSFRGRPGYRGSARAVGWLGFFPELSNQYDYTNRAEHTIFGLTANYRPFEWWSNRITIGLDNMDRVNELLYPIDTTGLKPWGTNAAKGYVNRFVPTYKYLTVDYASTLSHRFNEALTSDFSVGAQFVGYTYEGAQVWGYGLLADKVNLVGTAEQRFAAEGFTQKNSVGFYGQQQFGWRDRIFATVALRVDDNSAFGRDFTFEYYPKASLSWVISEEPFFNVPFVKDLKLRAAWGEAGNAPSAYAAERAFGASVAVINGQVVNRVVLSDYGNPDLKAETGSEIELGFDAALFDGRMTVEATYYDKHTKDALMGVADPPSSGFGGMHLENIAEIANHGFEVMVTASPVYTRNVEWNATASFSYNTNELVTWGATGVYESFFGDYANVQKHIQGYPLGGFWAIDVQRDENGNPILRTSNGQPCDDPAATNCNVVVDATDNYYVGPALPTREAALTNTVTLFGKLQLFAHLDYRGGNYQWCATCARRANADLNSWDVVNPDQDPLTRKILMSAQTRTWIRKADFIKLRELSATYTLPAVWTRRIGVDRASITLAGRNLWMWTKYFDGFDPEVLLSSTSSFGSTDYAATPMMRRLMVSTRFTF